MGSTKIINILKNDNFEDVFDEFKKAEAEEVIFILPKKSKIARNESHFVSLAGEAQSSQKKLTLMTADESAKSYAQKYGFRLLAEPSRPGADIESSADVEDVPADIDDFPDTDTLQDISPELSEAEEIEREENTGITEKEDEEEDYHPDADTGEYPSEDLTEEKEDENLADLAMAKYQNKRMSDIRQPEKTSRIKVTSGDQEKVTKPDLKKGLSSEKDFDKLKSIWLKNETAEKESSRLVDGWRKRGGGIWDNINLIKKDKLSNKTNLVFIASGVILLLVILYVFLGSAQIIIKPQEQPLDFQLNVLASSDFPEVDVNANKTPGQFLSYSADVSKDFTSSGQKEIARKAKGKIAVYNNFNSEPQGLIATTRFESSKGLIFRIPHPIVIPGAKLVSGKLVPGSVTAEVIADKPGAQYNINADRFAIPGFKGTPKFNGFYAESSNPMADGATGLAKVVTEQDFNTAKDAVTKEATDKALAGLKAKLNNLKITEAVNVQITSLKSTAQIDDAAEGFAMVVTAEAKTVAFSESDLLKVIEGFINQKGDLVLLNDSLSLNYSEPKIDVDKKTLNFKVTVKGQAAAKVDTEKIVNSLLGMKQSDIKDYLLGIKEVESARVILSPFWVKSVPKNRQDVEVKMVY